MEYAKIWTSWIEVIEPLNDSERGRLFTALLDYAQDEAKLPELKGNERYCWPLIKQAIDRERALVDKQRANGSKGGRPSKNPNKPNETQENPNKPNESHKDNDKDKEKDNSLNDDEMNSKDLRAGARETLSEAYPLTRIPDIWVDQLTATAEEYDLTRDMLREAIFQASAHGAASPVAYAMAVMQDMHAHGETSIFEYSRRLRDEGYI